MSNTETQELANQNDERQTTPSIEDLQSQLNTLSKTLESEKQSKERLLEESKGYKEKWQSLKSNEDSLAEKLKQDEELKLREKGQFEILLKQREESLNKAQSEMEELQGRLDNRDKAIVNFRKAAAFEAELGGKLKKQGYWSHVDFDKIAINPDNGEIDIESVKNVAGNFVKDFKELIAFPNNANMPNGTAASGSGSLSYEQWKQLPTLSEKRKRMKDVRK